MNKYEIINIPDNLDFTNPYNLSYLNLSGVVKDNYVAGMTLVQGRVVFDSTERSYWIYPYTDATKTLGAVSLRNTDIQIKAGDEITVEYDVEIIGTVVGNQLIGVRIDALKDDFTYIKTYDFMVKDYKAEYQTIRLTKVIDPSLIDTKYFNLSCGVMSSPISPDYQIKMRDIRVKINRNSYSITDRPIFSKYGIGMTNLVDNVMHDDSVAYPTSQARDTKLKSGIYGYYGSTNDALRTGGILIVLPYRSNSSSGTIAIEQLALINNGDPDAGLWSRSYNGSTSTWSAWRKIPKRVDVPAHNNSTGSSGDIAFDTTYLYLCTGLNSWVRIPITATTW